MHSSKMLPFPFQTSFQDLSNLGVAQIEEVLYKSYKTSSTLFNVNISSHSIDILANRNLMFKIFKNNSIEYSISTIEEIFDDLFLPKYYYLQETSSNLHYQFSFQNRFKRKVIKGLLQLDGREPLLVPHPESMYLLLKAFYTFRKNEKITGFFSYDENCYLHLPENLDAKTFKQLFLQLIPDQEKATYSNAFMIKFQLSTSEKNDELNQLQSLSKILNQGYFKMLCR